MKNIFEMNKKELIREYNDITYHIEHLGVGRWELAYQLQLEEEIAKRGYQLKTKYY